MVRLIIYLADPRWRTPDGGSPTESLGDDGLNVFLAELYSPFVVPLKVEEIGEMEGSNEQIYSATPLGDERV